METVTSSTSKLSRADYEQLLMAWRFSYQFASKSTKTAKSDLKDAQRSLDRLIVNNSDIRSALKALRHSRKMHQRYSECKASANRLLAARDALLMLKP